MLQKAPTEKYKTAFNVLPHQHLDSLFPFPLRWVYLDAFSRRACELDTRGLWPLTLHVSGALNLEPLRRFSVPDEPGGSARGDEFGLVFFFSRVETRAPKMAEALQNEERTRITHQHSNQSRGQFSQERSARLPSVLRRDETTPGPAKLSDEPGWEKDKTVNSTGGKCFRSLAL